jgi:hypothetical protein
MECLGKQEIVKVIDSMSVIKECEILNNTALASSLHIAIRFQFRNDSFVRKLFA